MHLIDANNLLHKLKGVSRDFPRDFGHGLLAMVNLLNTFGQQQAEHVLACFDGGPGDGGEATYTRPFVRVHFGYGRQADHLILEHLHASNDATRLTVVSSDNEVRAFARDYRARSLSSEDFAEILMAASHAHRNPKRQSKRDAHVAQHGLLQAPAAIRGQDHSSLPQEKLPAKMASDDGSDCVGEMLEEANHLDWNELVHETLDGAKLPKVPKRPRTKRSDF